MARVGDSGSVQGARPRALPGPFQYSAVGWRLGSPTGVVQGSLKLLSFNTLFDHWRGRPYLPQVVHSSTRYERLARWIEDESPELLALNEVTPGHLSLLGQRRLLQERYLLSAQPEEKSSLPPFGNLLLMSLPCLQLYEIHLPRLPRPALCAVLQLGEELRLLLCTVHLSSKWENAPRRARQLEALIVALEPLREAQGCQDVLICGDLNLHDPAEDEIIPSSYRDLWAELRPEEPGYTFDALRNPMLQEMWPLGFEYRRMRLDRILLRRGGQLSPHSIRLVLDQPIYASPQQARLFHPRWHALMAPRELLRRTLCQVADRLGHAGPRDMRGYLRCSDHFGLLLELRLPERSDL